MNTPQINVTPLIDVLLVLLIIFMVVSPLKPTAFKARIPAEPVTQPFLKPNPDTLLVSIDREGRIKLNTRPAGVVADSELSAMLLNVFAERAMSGVRLGSGADDVERTVFIKAPKALGYGSVAQVVDSVKMAGASPISLQIDDLE